MLPPLLKSLQTAYPDRFAPQEWTVLGTAGGFSGAEILRLETAAGEYCLRGWPRNSLSRTRILGLHRLLKHASSAGVTQIAVPVLTNAGESLATLRGQNWQLEPWMPGEAIFWSSPSPARLKNVIAALAEFHRVTQFYVDAGPAQAWFFHQDRASSPAVNERFKLLREWQSSKCELLKHALARETRVELREVGAEFLARFPSIAGVIGQQLELLRNVPFRLQPCWRDLWHDHVLFTGDEVSGLIDASACRAENVAADLARLLGSLILDDRSAWAMALQEYERFRPLDSHERALVTALDQSGVLLSGMTWMDRLILQKEPVAHWPKVIERLTAIQHRLRHLDVSQNDRLFE